MLAAGEGRGLCHPVVEIGVEVARFGELGHSSIVEKPANDCAVVSSDPDELHEKSFNLRGELQVNYPVPGSDPTDR